MGSLKGPVIKPNVCVGGDDYVLTKLLSLCCQEYFGAFFFILNSVLVCKFKSVKIYYCQVRTLNFIDDL